MGLLFWIIHRSDITCPLSAKNESTFSLICVQDFFLNLRLEYSSCTDCSMYNKIMNSIKTKTSSKIYRKTQHGIISDDSIQIDCYKKKSIMK